MVTAADLKNGMALRIDGQVFKVIELEARAGTAQMGGSVRALLANVRSGRLWAQHFRPLEKLQDVALVKRTLAFLYCNGIACVFQRQDTFEQVDFPTEALGLAGKFLHSGAEVTAEFYGDEPISIDVPATLECRVKETAPAARSQPDSGRKEATLDNGVRVQVPLFVAPGETVRIDLQTGRYIERVRPQHRKSA